MCRCRRSHPIIAQIAIAVECSQITASFTFDNWQRFFIAPKVLILGSRSLSFELISFSKKMTTHSDIFHATDLRRELPRAFPVCPSICPEAWCVTKHARDTHIECPPWLIHICVNWLFESSTCMSYVVYIPTVLVVKLCVIKSYSYCYSRHFRHAYSLALFSLWAAENIHKGQAAM